MTLMQRRRALMAASGAKGGLPSEYQQVEWIGHSEYAAINTNFTPTPASSMYARFAAVGTQGSGNFLGIRDASTGADKAFLIASFSSAHKIGFMRWGASTQCISYDTEFHDYELTPSTAKIDGVSYTLAAPVTTQSISKPINVFAEWNGTTWRQTANILLVSLSLWENGVKERDYVPCYRKADGEIGLYDLVNNVFYTAATSGAGTLTKGNDVN